MDDDAAAATNAAAIAVAAATAAVAAAARSSRSPSPPLEFRARCCTWPTAATAKAEFDDNDDAAISPAALGDGGDGGGFGVVESTSRTSLDSALPLVGNSISNDAATAGNAKPKRVRRRAQAPVARKSNPWGPDSYRFRYKF